jgi:hypothetical protein
MALISYAEKRAAMKPTFGATTRGRKAARKAIEAMRRQRKAEARARDSHQCRWPRCDCKALKLRLEVDHIVPLSLGGTDELENLLTLCAEKHAALHRCDADVEKLTKAGANGCLAFYLRDESGELRHVATEKAIGISEPRRANG